MMMALALAFQLSAAFAVSTGASSPLVDTPAGTLRGTLEGEVHVFKGIPYAEAPVGDLRWRPPVAAKPWDGVRDASSFGNYCLQKEATGIWHLRSQGGSEDCLYLNVYVPPDVQPNASLPCLVWIHGGGFELGAERGRAGFLRCRRWNWNALHGRAWPRMAAHGACFREKWVTRCAKIIAGETGGFCSIAWNIQRSTVDIVDER
ncbi:Pyrethroid hydrolase Ces2e (Carboxylic ester hydrolase) (carboxylesterase 2E) [Durusdinium trenchii]|uniref:Pyrethroid hydrolase Ces2e (Carboxylic ester hydrolase) (Carboxylesterase 2E) n=1 Tax=Durusdinium trenchii TaxID=1381693 RepID=A0ABP0LBT6_9DINO